MDDRPDNFFAGCLWGCALYALVIGTGALVWWMFFCGGCSF